MTLHNYFIFSTSCPITLVVSMILVGKPNDTNFVEQLSLPVLSFEWTQLCWLYLCVVLATSERFLDSSLPSKPQACISTSSILNNDSIPPLNINIIKLDLSPYAEFLTVF